MICGLRTTCARAQAVTLDAMRDGADVIFQATFFDGRWRGHADFLFKRPDRPSPLLGAWSYDIADTKLARSVKGGRDPPDVRLRGPAGAVCRAIARSGCTSSPVTASEHRYRTDDFSAYFRHVRARFDEPDRSQDSTDRTVRHLPEPGRPLPRLHAGTRCASSAGATTTTCRSWPGMRRLDTERLTADGVPTLARLAVLDPDRPPSTGSTARN